MTRKDYYNITQLKERGWTASIIKKLVEIEPTEFKGLYSRQPQKCYPKDYIEQLETTEQFSSLKAKAETRKTVMKAVAENKRIENIDKYSKLFENIKIPVLPEEILKKHTLKAKENWYSYQAELRCDFFDGIDTRTLDMNTLHCWEVNYIRHNLTKYEDILEKIHGVVGTNDIYINLRNKVLDEISSVYPYLKNECDRQKNI